MDLYYKNRFANNQMVLFIWIILIAESTSFDFAMDPRQTNMLLVFIMSVIPFFLITQYPFIFKKEGLIYLLFVAILISSLFHLESFRISTFLYTSLFLLTFIYYYRLITYVPLKVDNYVKLLKFLLSAYFVVLFIQQFCVLIGSPYILNFILGDIKIYKLNSLAPEPSHAAKIMMALMYSYVCMQELKLNRPYNLIKDGSKDKYMWFIFLYPMLTMKSGFALVLLLNFLIKFFKIKRVIYFLPFVLIIFMVVLNIDSFVAERVKKFGGALLSLNTDLMLEADHSASTRVVPTFLYINTFDIFNTNTWLGFGTDYSMNTIPTLMPGIREGEFLGGLFPSFFMDRGLICVATLFAMINKFCLRKLFSFDAFFLLLLIFSAGLNTQVFWLAIMLFTANKYLYSIKPIENLKLPKSKY